MEGLKTEGGSEHMNQEITRQIRVYGIVQGVGFRPTVSRHATARGIRGNVCNKGPYVEIYAQGSEEAVEEFISDIQNRPPKRAAILKINVENIETPEQYTQFDIIFADGCMERMTPGFEGTFVNTRHFAVSGKLIEK